MKRRANPDHKLLKTEQISVMLKFHIQNVLWRVQSKIGSHHNVPKQLKFSLSPVSSHADPQLIRRVRHGLKQTEAATEGERPFFFYRLWQRWPAHWAVEAAAISNTTNGLRNNYKLLQPLLGGLVITCLIWQQCTKRSKNTVTSVSQSESTMSWQLDCSREAVRLFETGIRKRKLTLA